jgi:broad specificity phosphatase PhoE
MKKLVLVRHGATEWSEAGRLTGWTDVPLSSKGREQALELRAQLAERSFDGIWSSDLCRASETAAIAAGDPNLDPRLRELDFGEIEGTTWNELSSDMQESLMTFDGFEAPRGESAADLEVRLGSFIDRLEPGTHLVVTHGGVIRFLLRKWLGDDRTIAPCEMVELEI